MSLSRRTWLAALFGGAAVAALAAYAWTTVGPLFALAVTLAALAVLVALATLSMVVNAQRTNTAGFGDLDRRLAEIRDRQTTSLGDVGRRLAEIRDHQTQGLESMQRMEVALTKRLDTVHTTIGLSAKRTFAQLFPLFKEVRYLADLQVDSERVPALEKGNALSRYAFERHQKHRRTVEFARNVEASKIRELYLGELFAGIEKVSVPVGAINELTGHPNKVDLLYVSVVARHLGAKDIFEFGTYLGRTTYHLTFASEGAHVTTLNLPPEADPRYAPYLGMYFRGTDRERHITQLYEDSRTFDVGPHRKRYDLVFVDGDHSYEGVENDTRKALELVKPGGAILWHDYAPKSEGLVRFFRDFTATHPVFRIKRTCVLLHLDGVDPMTFVPHPLPPNLEQDTDVDPLHVEELYHA